MEMKTNASEGATQPDTKPTNIFPNAALIAAAHRSQRVVHGSVEQLFRVEKI